MAGELNSTYVEITRTIKSVERKILAFQSRVVGQAGVIAAEDTNLAIILAARLSKVWRRLGTAANLQMKRC